MSTSQYFGLKCAKDKSSQYFPSSVGRFNCETNNIETFYCKNCNVGTQLTIFFKRHLQDHALKNQNSPYIIRKYICGKCSFETHFSMKWFQHTRTCRGKKENLQTSKKSVLKTFTWSICDQCGRKYKFKYSLEMHKISKHLKDDEISWFSCTKCSYKAKLKCHLHRHIKRQHLNEQACQLYLCDKCPYTTKYKATLKTHTTKHHSDESNIKRYPRHLVQVRDVFIQR